MKKNICFLLMIVSLTSYSQISTPVKLSSTTLGKVAPLGTFIADITYSGDVYTLSFNDLRFKTDFIKSVSFQNVDSTVDKLYNLFKDAFKSKEPVTFKLGSQEVTISRMKSMGVTSAMFTMGDAYFTMTEKQVDKLFAK